MNLATSEGTHHSYVRTSTPEQPQSAMKTINLTLSSLSHLVLQTPMHAYATFLPVPPNRAATLGTELCEMREAGPFPNCASPGTGRITERGAGESPKEAKTVDICMLVGTRIGAHRGSQMLGFPLSASKCVCLAATRNSEPTASTLFRDRPQRHIELLHKSSPFLMVKNPE